MIISVLKGHGMSRDSRENYDGKKIFTLTAYATFYVLCAKREIIFWHPDFLLICK